MRTTVALEPDVAAEVERLRRERGVGVSAAVNELISRGMVTSPPRAPFKQVTSPMGAKFDVTNIGEVLEIAEGFLHR